mmetsp:Transcript_38929/g.51326  ORF Transcript_38929/g.51326 Transcript_38929/m.51326 type:complete len:131 (+) Transcript_38929:90-482(+)
MSETSHIYHLVEKNLWKIAVDNDQPYYPTAYEQDGFIHCTAEKEKLLDIANFFYTGVSGDFLVLELELSKIEAEVKFERAMPVGDQAPPEQAEGEPLFPHLYGPILKEYVTKELAVERNQDGQFLSFQDC